MIEFNKIKIIGTTFIISSLLILLPGCEKKSPANEIDEEIDNVVKNIGESVKKENDRLINDRPEEGMANEPDEAAENIGDMIEDAK